MSKQGEQLSDNWYEDFLHETEKLEPHEVKRYECSCPIESGVRENLFFCKYLALSQRRELMYKSGEGYTKQWVERSLCYHKWRKDHPEAKEIKLDKLQTGEEGLEDTFGEGGWGFI